MAEPASADRDVLITGIGLVSCIGEGLDAHWAALTDPAGFRPVVDGKSFPPWSVHPMVPLDLDRQIARKGDQRQMEPWQRIGTYAAGLALDMAGAKDDAALLDRMDMFVAAGGGERDYAADAAILSALTDAADPDVLLNQRLMSDLRPTLFLAQLSNLLAGNISIVHGVIGSSRTLLGEEMAGADAIRISAARIAAFQGEIALVGGAYNAERADIVLHYEMGGMLWKRPFAPVMARQAQGGGMALGSVGCFLVLESRSHAAARGAPGIARIVSVASDRGARQPGQARASASRQYAALRHAAETAVISGASGVGGPTADEAGSLAGLGLPIRMTGTALGHSMEPSFVANVAIAAASVARGRLFDPLEPGETPMDSTLRCAIVTGWGHWRGEATALLVPAVEGGYR